MRFNIISVISVLITFMLTSGTASADCSLAINSASNTNLVARIDALADCVSRQQARIERLESAVLISEVPCTDLGEGWQLYAPAESRFIIGAGGKYMLGEQDGEEFVKLTVSEMPEHRHSIPIVSLQGSLPMKDAGTGQNMAYVAVPPSQAANKAQFAFHGSADGRSGVRAQGEGLPHNNMPPYIAMHFCKKG